MKSGAEENDRAGKNQKLSPESGQNGMLGCIINETQEIKSYQRRNYDMGKKLNLYYEQLKNLMSGQPPKTLDEAKQALQAQ